MAKPASYWRNTSDNAIIRSFIEYAGNSITKKLEILLSGGYILQQIDENLTYDYLHSSEDNLWSVLYLTGYLTKVRNEELEKTLPENILALQIPNAEIREIFETTVIKWFDDSAKIWNRSVMRLCIRLIKECMQKNLKMNMTVFCVMESHFSKNDVVSE